jgi:hypothetical protein
MGFMDRMRGKSDDRTKPGLIATTLSEMELPPPLLGTSVCSDDQCPCDEWAPESQMPPAQGYMYIAPEVVEFRKDCLSVESLERKLKKIEAETGGIIFGGKNVMHPVVVCEQGARLRNLDLQVAAQDFDLWMSCGRIPCRPTPCAHVAKSARMAIRVLIAHTGDALASQDANEILKHAWDGPVAPNAKITSHPLTPAAWASEEQFAVAWTMWQQMLEHKYGEHAFWDDHETHAYRGTIVRTGQRFYVEIYYQVECPATPERRSETCCPSCGTELPVDAVRCNKCGHRFV